MTREADQVPEADQPDGQGYRIDLLATRSGTSVDTIRFYQREGLLDPPVRHGRTAVYGPGHLRRLEQIRELQGRHLTLAAIRDLLEARQLPLAATIFMSGSGDYTRAQLAAAAGLSADLVGELLTAGLLRSPEALGRDSFDDVDLRLLAAVRRLLDIGLPRPMLVRLGAIYAQSFARLRAEVLDLFTGEGAADLVDDLDAVQDLLAARAGEALEPVQALLDYSHVRAVQELTWQALARAQLDGPPGAPGTTPAEAADAASG